VAKQAKPLRLSALQAASASPASVKPEKRARSWENTIAEQRNRAERQLSENPSLKTRVAEAVEHGYRSARLEASSETNTDVESFPEECPYDWHAILHRPFKR
jgi:hypothetical protein